MNIRRATDQDWPLIYPFYAAIMAEGKTYPFPEHQTLDEARPWWMEQPPGQTVVAVSEGVIVGSAKMGPNRPGRGSHVATASFLVDPARRGQGIGRALGEYVLGWCRSAGFASIQFNAVVETNAAACTCGGHSGSRSSARYLSPSITLSTAGSACTSCTGPCDTAQAGALCSGARS